MRLHLIGVSGAGMAPLAGLLRQAGHEVSGSDSSFDPPMGPRLAEWGVVTRQGFDPCHLDALDPATDAVVVGNVCRRDHPLAVAAEARGLRRISMPTALRELVFTGKSGIRPVIAVAGTHGKTTTTALLAAILALAGLEPGWLIGGIPLAIPGTGFTDSPFALGRASRSLVASGPLAPFVIEGDEYDSAFFEKVPKVWGYAPKAAILTSIEHDHVDIYPTKESYRDAFVGLLERLPSEEEGGLLVANCGDRAVVELVSAVRPRCRVVYYAGSDTAGRPFPSGDTSGQTPIWTGHEVGLAGDGDAVQSLDLFVGPSSAGRFGVGIFGTHNVSNTVGALALAAEMFAVPVRDMMHRLGAFRGTRRRLERLVDGATSPRGVSLYDDFAHHPTAVEATLSAVRNRHRSARVVAVYEPRSATACRSMHQQAYETAFAPADVVVLAPLGRTTIPEAERLDLARLAESLRAAGKTVHLPHGHDAVTEVVLGLASAGDVVVAMSNGAFGGVTAKLAGALS
jgi:UDP-N-acetylmuramate: L-alanyl-gamma-D-glutamyl-meso-diaminopimelate ligase